MSFAKAFAIAVVGATVLAAPAFAKGSNGSFKGANSSFAGSKSVQTRPTPLPPRTTGRPQVNVIDHKIKLRCYHTRERNEFGVSVHRTHCG
jgi:hypothetical protein